MQSDEISRDGSPPQNHPRRPESSRTQAGQQNQFGRRNSTRAEPVKNNEHHRKGRRGLTLEHANAERLPLDDVRQIRILTKRQHFSVQRESVRIHKSRDGRQLRQQEIPEHPPVPQQHLQFACSTQQVDGSPDRKRAEQTEAHHERSVHVGPQGEQQRHPYPHRTVPLLRREERKQPAEHHEPRQLRPHNHQLFPVNPQQQPERQQSKQATARLLPDSHHDEAAAQRDRQSKQKSHRCATADRPGSIAQDLRQPRTVDEGNSFGQRHQWLGLRNRPLSDDLPSVRQMAPQIGVAQRKQVKKNKRQRQHKHEASGRRAKLKPLGEFILKQCYIRNGRVMFGLRWFRLCHYRFHKTTVSEKYRTGDSGGTPGQNGKGLTERRLQFILRRP